MSQVVGLPNNSYKPITNTAQPGFVNYKNGCTRLAAASDKVYQLLVHGRWFSLGTAASSNTKTGRHDIVEILLKVALNTKKSINQPKLNVIRVSPLILVTFVLLNILFSVQCFVDHWLSICLFLNFFILLRFMASDYHLLYRQILLHLLFCVSYSILGCLESKTTEEETYINVHLVLKYWMD